VFIFKALLSNFIFKVFIKKDEIIPYSIHEIKEWANDYKIGNGFDAMFQNKSN